MTSPTPTSADTILFRPSKKRKIYRQRTTENEDEQDAPHAPASIPVPEAQSLDDLIASSGAIPNDVDVEGTRVSIAELVRWRKRNKRGGGVEFRAQDGLGSGLALKGEEGALVLRERNGDDGVDGDGVQEEGGISGSGVPRKFAPQTGAVGDVNKHMMAYIDSELAKRRAESLTTTLQSTSGAITTPRTGLVSSKSPDASRQTDSKKPGTEVSRQPAALGKLLEIDLGDEARDRNVERTNQARRRLDGEDIEEEAEKKPVKVRLGRDGKPWRGRKRRASEDIKRDKLVEEVMRENRLEIYDEPVVEPTTVNGDQAADDRIAEAFRKEFMDAVSQRQRKKAVPAPPPTRNAAGKKEEEVLKGPKLGGSRNARAAMRDSMLKAAAKK